MIIFIQVYKTGYNSFFCAIFVVITSSERANFSEQIDSKQYQHLLKVGEQESVLVYGNSQLMSFLVSYDCLKLNRRFEPTLAVNLLIKGF